MANNSEIFLTIKKKIKWKYSISMSNRKNKRLKRLIISYPTFLKPSKAIIVTKREKVGSLEMKMMLLNKNGQSPKLLMNMGTCELLKI